MHTHIQASIHTRTQRNTHSYTHSHTHKHIQTCKHTLTHAHTYKHTHTYSSTKKLTHRHPYSDTHAHSHRHTTAQRGGEGQVGMHARRKPEVTSECRLRGNNCCADVSTAVPGAQLSCLTDEKRGSRIKRLVSSYLGNAWDSGWALDCTQAWSLSLGTWHNRP